MHSWDPSHWLFAIEYRRWDRFRTRIHISICLGRNWNHANQNDLHWNTTSTLLALSFSSTQLPNKFAELSQELSIHWNVRNADKSRLKSGRFYERRGQFNLLGSLALSRAMIQTCVHISHGCLGSCHLTHCHIGHCWPRIDYSPNIVFPFFVRLQQLFEEPPGPQALLPAGCRCYLGKLLVQHVAPTIQLLSRHKLISLGKVYRKYFKSRPPVHRGCPHQACPLRMLWMRFRTS